MQLDACVRTACDLPNQGTNHPPADPLARLQNKLLGNLGIVGHACTVQLEFRDPTGAALPLHDFKIKRDETQRMPRYTSKDAVIGEVRVTPIPGKKVRRRCAALRLHVQVEAGGVEGCVQEQRRRRISAAAANALHTNTSSPQAPSLAAYLLIA